MAAIIGLPWMRPHFDDRAQTFPTKTVEIECIVRGDVPSYLIGGVRQTRGDRCRLPVGDAQDLERRGKCRIVGDEKVEML